MGVEPVNSVASSSARRLEPMGISAELADARSRLRKQAPPDRWDAVMDEVSRVQTEQGLSLLAALHVVYARLAAGWIPPAR